MRRSFQNLINCTERGDNCQCRASYWPAFESYTTLDRAWRTFSNMYARRPPFQEKIVSQAHPVHIPFSSHLYKLVLGAEVAFFTGLSCYDAMPDKVRIVTTSSRQVQSAARYFRRACDLGKKEAFRYLGDIYFDGKGIESSYQKAVNIYVEGVAKNDPGSMFALGWCYEYGMGVSVCPIRALRLYDQAMEEGCGEAIANVGLLKLRGKLYQTNHLEAGRLLKKALDMDVFAAKENLATCYQCGISVDSDPKKAYKLYHDAFHEGDLLCAVELATCYDQGFGVERNPVKATKVYEICMKKGTWEGGFFAGYYGLRMVLGHGIKKNMARGKEIILSSTKNNSAYGWHALGELYRYGLGVDQSKQRARELYLKSAYCGNGVVAIVDSLLALAEMYEQGEGIQTDNEIAHEYYLKAANRLSPEAQWKVGVACESGIGMDKDIDKAVFYFRLCANSGYFPAQRKYIKYYTDGHGVERNRFDTTIESEQQSIEYQDLDRE